MAFRYCRTIRFHETDAAGVVYFANVLTLCHEAYEAALGEAFIDVADFFSTSNPLPIPIVHAEASYFKPLRCGDKIAITLAPLRLTPYSYEVRYTLTYQQSGQQSRPETHLLTQSLSAAQSQNERPLATALTRHVCIDKTTRQKQIIDPRLDDWLNEPAAIAAPDD
ncbi:acyl-CoA thioesterase [cf. Phormidesmis sp. LEGE 11477]|nr:acyl-CoA thioesterase [cf. Phormidesmis sp. LEGE 11477]